MFQNSAETSADLLVKATPAVAVSSLNFLDVSLPEIVQILTGIYVFLMAVDKVYIMFIRYRENRLKELHEIKGENESPK